MSTSFEQLREDLADLANEVTPVDLRDRVLATSHKIGTHRAVATAAALAAVLIISAGTAYAMRPQQHVASPAAPTPTTTPIATTASPAPTESAPSNASGSPTPPTSATPRSSGTGFAADPRTIKIVNASINMPAWPGLRGRCPAGVFHFVHGDAQATGGSDPNMYHLRYEEGTPANLGRVVYGDLDGQSTNEAVLTVQCSGDGSLNPMELMAVRLMPDGTVRTLGFVIATPDRMVFDYDDLSVVVHGSTVLAQVEGDHASNGGPAEVKQVRGYRDVNGAFKQISGPTTFPKHPTDVGSVDVRNTTIAFGLEFCCGIGVSTPVLMVNGSGTENYIVKRTNGTYTIESVTFAIQQSVVGNDGAGNKVALLRVTEKGSGVQTTAAVYAASTNSHSGMLYAEQVTAVGQDGITGIVGLASSTDLPKVTVKTANGQHVFGYRQDANGNWKRVN